MDAALALEVEKQYRDKEIRDGDCMEWGDRKGFVIKVYSIVATQILLTALLCVASLNNVGGLQDFMRSYSYLSIVAIVIGVCLICAIACCKVAARKVPLNYIILFTFTLVWGYMVAGFVIWFKAEAVMICASLTFFMFLGLTLYAIFAKKSLTYCMGIFIVFDVMLFPLILFCIFWPSNFMWNLVYFAFIVLTSCYIVYDTKLIMKKLNQDEYIIGALMLYVDLIQLFMCLL